MKQALFDLSRYFGRGTHEPRLKCVANLQAGHKF